MKIRIIDITLIIVIFLSSLFIAHRLLRPNASSESAVSSPLLEHTSTPNTFFAAPPVQRYASRVQQYIAELTAPSEQEWLSIQTNPKLKSYLTDATRSCDERAPELQFYAVMTPELRASLRDKETHLFIDPEGRFCMRKGTRFIAYYIGSEPSDPNLSLLANVLISGMIQIPFDAIDNYILQLLRLDSERFFTAFPSAKNHNNRDITFSRMISSEPTTMDLTKPIPAFPKTDVLTSATLQQWLSKYSANLVIVDTRSPSESKAKPIRFEPSQVLNIEYKLTRGASYDSKRTTREILADSFDIVRIINVSLQNNNAPILFIGTTPTDGRPAWALRHTLETPIRKIAWFYDGVDTFNNAVSDGL